jgi:SSS family solute:Na+ symporter
VLSARSEAETQRVLLYNGVLRFPLVLGYCLLGLGLAAYASLDPAFVGSLPATGEGTPNYNLAYPFYVLQHFAPGFVGLVMVGIFAAAMSSIDSSINSLSAATVEDFVQRSGRFSERQLFVASKLTTLFWGAFAVVFSFQVERIAPTVLEAINKIGSMVNGPLLALFTIALVAPRVGQARAVAGFFAGAAANAVLWLGFPEVSWLWWNVFGFAAALTVSFACLVPRLVPRLIRAPDAASAEVARTLTLPRVDAHPGVRRRLLIMAVLIFAVCLGLDRLPPF